MVAEVLKVSVKGSMPGGEVWSVNPCFKLFTSLAITDAQMSALAIAAAAVSIPSGLASKWNSLTTMTGVRVEARELTGDLYKVAEATKVTPVAGTGSGALPYQSAAVVTLKSQIASGRGRGRLYWPATGVVLSSTTLRMTAGDALSFAQSTDTYLTSLQVALESALSGPDLNLCVWSRTQGVGFVVYNLTVGDVIDTQRRRRDSLKETLQSVAYQGATA